MNTNSLPRIKIKVGNKRKTTAFTKDEVKYFTTGDCWRLALEVQRLFGYPVVAVSTVIYKPDWGLNLSWVHVVNQIGEDKFLDILGIQSQEEVEGNWSFHLATLGHEPYLRKLSAEQQVAMFAHVQPKYSNNYDLSMIATRVVGAYIK